MRYQDYIVNATRAAAAEMFRYAKAVPADKLDWAPLDAGRTVLDQCRECAKCPDWALSILKDEPMSGFDEESSALLKAEMDEWKTPEQCEAVCNEKLDALFEFISAFPDERLSDTNWLPFEGGRDFTKTEQMDYPRWNFNYHLGQIAYVQILFGDKEMH